VGLKKRNTMVANCLFLVVVRTTLFECFVVAAAIIVLGVIAKRCELGPGMLEELENTRQARW